jgi:hypothetical protein
VTGESPAAGTTQTDGVHHPYDVLTSQEQNLAWDSRLRRTYSNWVLGAALGWAAVGILVGIVSTDSTITQSLLSFFIPSLAAFQLAHEIWLGQRRVSTERERLAWIIVTSFAPPATFRTASFGHASISSRVPEWFYRRHRRHDEPASPIPPSNTRCRLGLSTIRSTPPPGRESAQEEGSRP